jgi:cyclopropane-fatty-acyl-phospholipid synthase
LLSVRIRSRRALRGTLRAPYELALARAYVSGQLLVDPVGPADLVTALRDPRVLAFGVAARTSARSPVRTFAALVGVLRLTGLGPGLPAPPEEAHIKGRRHLRGRDAAAIAHHYDLGNDFYRLLLGESMVYSCAYWRCEPCAEYGLVEAQRDKLELVCRKLGLGPGQRLLDVGCGWGSLVMHAAAHHGVRAVGITLSQRQAALAVERVRAAGLADRVDIRIQDYRDIHDGPYQAVASVGMAEHLGRVRYSRYAGALRGLLEPGGHLLHSQITVPASVPAPRRGRFIDRYIFPDGELVPIGYITAQLERAGLEIVHVESLREHYVPTLRAWLDNLDRAEEAAIGATSPGRVRAWRLYLAGSAAGFAAGRLGVHQILAVVPPAADTVRSIGIERTHQPADEPVLPVQVHRGGPTTSGRPT